MPRGSRHRSTTRLRAGTTLAVLGVVGTLLGVRTHALDRLDRWMGTPLSRPRGTLADRLVGVATDLGSVYGLAGTAAVLAATGRPRQARTTAVAGALAWCAAQGAKPLANRPRPYQADGVTRLVAEPAGSSWPSGHAAVAAAMAAALAPRLDAGARVAAGLTALGVGCSRLYVGVHHPSDVVAGLGLGVLSAAVSRRWGCVAQETVSGSGRPTTDR